MTEWQNDSHTAHKAMSADQDPLKISIKSIHFLVYSQKMLLSNTITFYGNDLLNTIEKKNQYSLPVVVIEVKHLILCLALNLRISRVD